MHARRLARRALMRLAQAGAAVLASVLAVWLAWGSSFFGPVLAPAPTGDAALRLWDAFVALGEFDGLYEIKRSRRTGPQFGPRPEL